VTSEDPNTVGKASLFLGILSAAFVFGIGLCAVVGLQQGWLAVAGTPLYVCGASSAFLGLIGVVLGVVGLFGKGKRRAAAIAGLLLGFLGICLFIGVVSAVGGG